MTAHDDMLLADRLRRLGRIAFTLAAIAALTPHLLASGSSTGWDVDGHAFSFPAAGLRDRFAVKGLGGLAPHVEQDLVLAFDGDAWRLSLDGADLLTGSYVQPGPRRVELELDAHGAQQIVARHDELAHAWAHAELLGETASDLDPWRTRLRLRLRRQHGDDFDVVVARLHADVRTQGFVQPADLANPRAARGRTLVRGTSEGIPEMLLDGSPTPDPPLASFVLGATTGEAPLTVGLLSTASGIVTERRWNFGDGLEAEGVSVLHTFGPGEHLVTHTAGGPGGLDSTSQIVSVVHPPLPLQLLYLGWDLGATPSPLDDQPVLVPMPGAQTFGSVVFGGGDELVFGIDLLQPTNGADEVALELSVGTSLLFGAFTEHELEISLRWLRALGDPVVLLGPTTRLVNGPSKVSLHESSGTQLLAAPGDRLELVLHDLSPADATGSTSVEVFLGTSRVFVAGPP